jgi:hypothetical protein
MAQPRTYDVKLTRTTIEETILTVEAPNQINAACAAGLKAPTHEGWTLKSCTVEVTEPLWKQGGEN